MLRNYMFQNFGICLEGLRKITKTQDRRLQVEI
jgi:hypothetical protein